MKKLRFILLSAVLAAVFGFSFIGCSNYSSNGGSSKHGMTIQFKDASNDTYTYYADYAEDDNLARDVYKEMKVFNFDGTKIEDDSISIKHQEDQTYRLNFYDGTKREVWLATKAPYEFTSYVKHGLEDTKKILGLTINGKEYTYVEK